MSANIFGERLKMISFGESHGPAYGIVIDGIPAGLEINSSLIQADLDRRRPGQNEFVTARQEKDEFEILSGVYLNKTLGTPIACVVRNTQQKSSDYDDIQLNPRIGHADDTWKEKFGHVDHRGGGRSSGRETLNRVLAGSIAKMLVKEIQTNNKQNFFTELIAYPTQVANIKLTDQEIKTYQATQKFPNHIIKLLSEAKQNGESYGGIVECSIKNIDKALGQPIFHKFKSDLAQGMMSLGAVTAFEFGSGFTDIDLKGTEFHQAMNSKNYGGIRGGLTTGEEIVFRLAFKPTSSIKDVAKKGRHDPCIVPRAIPVVEAIAWFIIADHVLWKRTDRL